MVSAQGYCCLSPAVRIYLPHGRTAFIKQALFPTHRTLHETFGARRPSSVTPRWGAPASPRGKPREMLRIRPEFHKNSTACRKTPLRLAKSRLTAVARLHGACGRTSQALWACPFPFQGRQEWLRIGILVSHVDKRVEMLYIIFDCIFQIKIQKRIGEDRCIWTITSAGGPRSWRMRR